MDTMATRRVHELAIAFAHVTITHGVLAVALNRRATQDLDAAKLDAIEVQSLGKFIESSAEVVGFHLVGWRELDWFFYGILPVLGRTPRITIFMAHDVGTHPTTCILAVTNVLNACKHLRIFEFWNISLSHRNYTRMDDESVKAIINSKLRELSILGENAPNISESQLIDIVSHNATLLNIDLPGTRCTPTSPPYDGQVSLFDAIKNNYSLLSLSVSMSSADKQVLWTMLDRNMRVSWSKFQYKGLLNVCIGLSTLRLSSYDILEIASWLIERPGPDPYRLRRLRLIDGVAASLGRIAE
jgi:hypothetical protein